MSTSVGPQLALDRPLELLQLGVDADLSDKILHVCDHTTQTAPVLSVTLKSSPTCSERSLQALILLSAPSITPSLYVTPTAVAPGMYASNDKSNLGLPAALAPY